MCPELDSLYVSEYFSQSAQKLSFYSWYGNAKLFHFRVPEDTVLLRWLLQASRGKGPECTNMEITVYANLGVPWVFVPKHAAGMRFELRNCLTSEQKPCAVRVVLGSITLPQSFQRIITCVGRVNCSLALDSPPWEKWLQIMVESLGAANASVSVEMLATFRACRLGSTSSFLNFNSLNQSQTGPRPGSAGAAGSPTSSTGGASRNASDQRSFCLQNQPVVREDLDVVSVRYRLLNGPSVPVNSLSPTLLLLNLNTGMDSGGSLVVSLLLNKVRRLIDGIVSPLWGFVPAPGLVCQQTPGLVGTGGTVSLSFCCDKTL
ncbi:transhypothetical protein [Limosa lapponica baueri]|uniref:Transmembrane protein 8a n=1 Tax=Limosa lapponica baueri TaxID=1758121 RepID=A0A2I0T5T2_LIMLA|nr:transhypothetical protein [Limosa lapponica baueri]